MAGPEADPPGSAKGCCTPARAGAPEPARAPAAARDGTAAAPDAVAIAGGQALVGTARAELPVDGEGPLRRKRVAPFRIDRCAVTNARFAAFAAATGYVTDAERLGDSMVFEALLPEGTPPSRAVAAAPWWRVIEGASWRRPCGPAGGREPDPDDPVVHVSWHDAAAFAAWAGGRLPTEAEWEHAARGGLGDVRYPWGDAEPGDRGPFLCNIWQGRFPDFNTGADGYRGVAPARSFEPNGYGLYNMAGNVWEWTGEPFRVRSLKKGARAHPMARPGYKLSKGGSFLCHASYCYRYRIAARSGTSADSSASHQGFRVVYPEA